MAGFPPVAAAQPDQQPVMNGDKNKYYMLIVLLVIQAYNYVDRQALGLVLQDIKVDLRLSDTQLGLLTGIPFAVFYSFMGIPIARWADRGNRVAIIALTVALWSAMVALCGKALSFSQLVLLRAGVGVGEAGCIPPAQSLIADYFPRAQRPWANSIYMLGGPLSGLVGLFLAGWLNQLYGWRATFVLLGLPGLALAPLAWLSLKEPRVGKLPMACAGQTLRSQSKAGISTPGQPSLKEVAGTLWTNRTFRYLLFYWSVAYFLTYGIAQFQPTFLMRSYGLKTGEVGAWYAAAFGLGGLIGIYSGGQLALRYAANNERLQLRVGAATYFIYAIGSACIYMSTNHYVAFSLMAAGAVVVNLLTGPLFAAFQTLVPPRVRASSIAALFLAANLIGNGLGPLAAGVLSDALRPHFGEESLRYALLALCPGYVWGAWFLWRASQTIMDDLQMAQKQADGEPMLEPS